mgnify:CR=1 FL=1
MAPSLIQALTPLAAALAMTGAAKAQDPASVELEAGFTPDPRVFEVSAGGQEDAGLATRRVFECRGWIETQWDAEVIYSGGTGEPLTFSVDHDRDATLVVRDPLGEFHCNDDSFGLHPAVTFETPADGPYWVWVGTFLRGAPAPATLAVSGAGRYAWEVETRAAASGAAQALAPDYTLPAVYGDVTLAAQERPDRYEARIVVAGSLEVSETVSGCAGWVARAPDLQLRYVPSDPMALTIAANSSQDLTLLVNDPSGRWLCDDDGGQGVNPLVRLEAPSTGVYDIWVGTYHQSREALADLIIFEEGAPAPLEAPEDPAEAAAAARADAAASSASTGPVNADGLLNPNREAWSQAVPGRTPLSPEGGAAALAFFGRCRGLDEARFGNLDFETFKRDLEGGGSVVFDYDEGGAHADRLQHYRDEFASMSDVYFAVACLINPYLQDP